MSKMSNNGTSPLILNLGLKLETIVPSRIKRQTRGNGSTRHHSVASTLRGSVNKKLSMTTESESLPNGWTKVKHPDSGFYYVHKEKNLCTWSDVLRPRTYSLIMDSADMLQRSPALQALVEDREVGLVLDVQDADGPTKTSYYCVSHVERRVFWLEGIGHEEVEIPCTSNKCMEKEGMRSTELRVHCIEAQYWKHCELFPTTLRVTGDLTGELKDVLLQAAADRLLVRFSTSPYDKDALEYMLRVVKEVEEGTREGSGYAGWIVARFMGLYNDDVLQSSYGQSDDYFDMEDTKPIGPYRRHILLTIFGPLFLRTPFVYATQLHSFRESFTLERWSNFVHKVDQSIRDSNLLATVLLSTNVGFLAWSETGKTDGINSPTAEQIVIYISIICSVGSIITGLAIFKQYRRTGADTPLRAVVLLKRILEQPFGLERLAIICSIPYVLLMWSLIAFLVAFGIIFYRDTGIQVRIPVTITLFLGCFFVFCCTYTTAPGKKVDKSQEPTGKEAEFDSSKAEV